MDVLSDNVLLIQQWCNDPYKWSAASTFVEVHDADLCAYIDQRQKEHYGEAELPHFARQPDHRIRQRHVRWSTGAQQVYKQTFLFQLESFAWHSF